MRFFTQTRKNFILFFILTLKDIFWRKYFFLFRVQIFLKNFFSLQNPEARFDNREKQSKQSLAFYKNED